MYEIQLVNMPFSALDTPSLALTQLKSALEREYGERVAVSVHYLNHDAASHIGLELYQYITLSMDSLVSGLGEWFFRQAAFPHVPENSAEYFRRYLPQRNKETEAIRSLLLEKQAGLPGFLEDLADKHHLYRAQVVGFTSLFFQNNASFALARILKARNPNIITIIGGANCEGVMGETVAKNVGQIDFVFSGPALKSLPQFIGYCIEGEYERRSQIDGVFCRDNLHPPHGSLVQIEAHANGSYGQDEDIDARPLPDYADFLNSLDRHFPDGRITPVLVFESSRGCWWGERSHCSFCGLNDALIGYRAMTPRTALRQFEHLFTYLPRCSRFAAADAIMPHTYPEEVFAHLKTPEDVLIFYEIRANATDRDLELLAQAGVRVVQVGIEALSTASLKRMRKGTTAFQNIAMLLRCLVHGVYPSWNLLVGAPGEDASVYEKYLRDIPLLLHLPPPTGLCPIRFDRFSPYFCDAQAHGLDLRPYDFYRLAYPFEPESLKHLAYYFADHNYKASYGRILYTFLEKLRKTIQVWRERWHESPLTIPPHLFFTRSDGADFIEDTRSGSKILHPIDACGLKLLQLLSTARSVDSLAHTVPEMSAQSIQSQLATFRDRGLIFEEGEFCLSLVCPAAPASMSFKVAQGADSTKDSGTATRESLLRSMQATRQ